MLKVQSLFFQIGEIGSHFPEHGNFFPPGGSADLLALCWLLHFWENEK